MSSNKQYNMAYVVLVTFVAALGGLLFGYDTAVISGTTGALKSFFIDPLMSDHQLAARVMFEYHVTIACSTLLACILFTYFFFNMFKKKKATIITIVMFLIAAIVIYWAFFKDAVVLDANAANSIRGFVISSALVGCIAGGAIGGLVSNRMGRRNGMILAAILFGISAWGSAFPDGMNIFGVEMVTSLIIYRIIGGIGVGLASMLAPMYIAEMAPAKYRGMLVSLNQFAIIFGMNVVYFVNYYIANQGTPEWLNNIGWRWMFGSENVPIMLFLVCLLFVPETPRYLVMKDKEEGALKVLKRLFCKEEAEKEIVSIKESLVEKNSPWLTYGIWVIIVGILISFFQQAVGINVVLYYAPEIFRNMGSNTDTSLLQTVIVGIVNLTFTVVAVFTVDKFGRKPLMIIGALGMAVSMLLLGLTFYFKSVGMGSLILMLIYTASFAVSWGPVAWVLLSEIFPNSIRSAMSIAVAFQWISNLVVSWTFPMMNDNAFLTSAFNHGFAYWIYAVMGIVAALFIWFALPETKGMTLEQMNNIWKPRHKKD
jgi:SP family xylose:H+ symportor-like MFS transporter